MSATDLRLTEWLMECYEERAHPTYRDERFKQAAKELKRSWAENDALKNAIDSYRRIFPERDKPAMPHHLNQEPEDFAAALELLRLSRGDYYKLNDQLYVPMSKSFTHDSITAASYIYEDCRARGQSASEAMRKATGRLVECQRDPRLSQPKCHSCGGFLKIEEGGICLPCHTEGK